MGGSTFLEGVYIHLNDIYTPPKSYPVTFGDQKFWIRLYDSQGNEIELPNDGKENLIVESIMLA